ncbi:MAG: hypothetical protein DHS20C16_11000 [Phycisphaerae bacterium]|nr:MAG: hypothetical protein DHS20C16_11000 [Phycisphaerae bacterium]
MSARAYATQITLTDVDGTTSVGKFISLSIDHATWQFDGEERATPLEDLAKITFHRRHDQNRIPRPCMAYPKAGGQLSGAVLESMPDGVIIRTTFAERFEIPFADLRAITFEEQGWPTEVRSRFETALDSAQAGEDILLARSEKAADGVRAIHGVLVELGPTAGEFRFNDRARRIRLEKIHALVFAASLDSISAAQSTLRLASGDAFAGSLGSIEDGQLTFSTSFKQTVTCAIDDVESLTLNGDRIIYLDTLEPHSHSSSGVVHDGWTFRKNRNVFNKTMRMDGVAFEHGIGVHAHSEIQYRLAGAYETFAATIGLDDAVRPSGSVSFKIMVDGKIAYDGKPMTGSERAVPVNVSVAGAEWLTLIVESADRADVGDWANWASARLVKPKTQS